MHYSVSKCLEIFLMSIYYCFLVWSHCSWWTICTILILLNLLRIISGPWMRYMLEYLLWHWKRMCFLLLLEGVSCKSTLVCCNFLILGCFKCVYYSSLKHSYSGFLECLSDNFTISVISVVFFFRLRSSWFLVQQVIFFVSWKVWVWCSETSDLLF